MAIETDRREKQPTQEGPTIGSDTSNTGGKDGGEKPPQLEKAEMPKAGLDRAEEQKRNADVWKK